MVSTDAKLAGIVTRLALAISFVVATALPIGYAIKEFGDMSDRMMLRAKAKAASISRLVTSNPELWKYSEHRLQDVLEGGVMPLGTDSVQVYDVDGSLVTHAGNAPPEPHLRRSAAIYDAGRVAGSVEVTTSLHGLIYRTAVAALFGLLLGSSIFVLLRVLPLRALKRVTHALFEQKERVEVTLHSIGDAVITTDACECVEYMNPVAERLTGWALSEAKGAPLDKILRLWHVFLSLAGVVGHGPSNRAGRSETRFHTEILYGKHRVQIVVDHARGGNLELLVVRHHARRPLL